jgi:hypothetical protein
LKLALEDSLSKVFESVDGECKLLQPYPRKVFTLEEDGEKSLRELGLSNASLNVVVERIAPPAPEPMQVDDEESEVEVDDQDEEEEDSEEDGSDQDHGSEEESEDEAPRPPRRIIRRPAQPRQTRGLRDPWAGLSAGQALGSESSPVEEAPEETMQEPEEDQEMEDISETQDQIQERRARAMSAIQNRQGATVATDEAMEENLETDDVSGQNQEERRARAMSAFQNRQVTVDVPTKSIGKHRDVASLRFSSFSNARSLALSRVLGLIKTLPSFHKDLKNAALTPNLASQVLERLENPTSESMMKIARICPVVYNMQLDRVPESAVVSGLKSWGHTLKTLVLTGSSIVDKKSWATIWACQSMEKISIQGSVAVYGPSEPVVGLKQLELSSCSLARFKGQSISMLSGIESLVLKGCTGVSVDLLDHVQSKVLKHLDLSRVEINVKLNPSLFPRLESLDISGTLTTRLDGLPGGLHRLLLSRCPIGAQELARVPTICPSLQELRLPNKIDPAMDAIVSSSFTGLPLVRLDLEGASKLTDDGIHGLACLRENLTFLSLVGTGISDASMNVVGAFTVLEELYLDRTRISTLNLPGILCYSYPRFDLSTSTLRC